MKYFFRFFFFIIICIWLFVISPPLLLLCEILEILWTFRIKSYTIRDFIKPKIHITDMPDKPYYKNPIDYLLKRNLTYNYE